MCFIYFQNILYIKVFFDVLQVLLREDIQGLSPADLLRTIPCLPWGVSQKSSLPILSQHQVAFHQIVHRKRGI